MVFSFTNMNFSWAECISNLVFLCAQQMDVCGNQMSTNSFH